MIIRIIMVVILVASLPTKSTVLTDFKNTLDRTGNPKQFKEYDRYQNQRFNPFFDLGAWHGFLLPKNKNTLGAFNGPMIIAQEYSLFIASQLEKL